MEGEWRLKREQEIARIVEEKRIGVMKKKMEEREVIDNKRSQEREFI